MSQRRLLKYEQEDTSCCSCWSSLFGKKKESDRERLHRVSDDAYGRNEARKAANTHKASLAKHRDFLYGPERNKQLESSHVTQKALAKKHQERQAKQHEKKVKQPATTADSSPFGFGRTPRAW